MSRAGLPGLRWYPGDGALSASTVAICLIGCPALAWFVGRKSARDATANPLAVRRTAVPRPPSKWGGLLLLSGLGIVCGFCATGLMGHPASSLGVNALLVVAGVVMTGVGLVLTLPLLSYALASRVARTTQSLTLNLAIRRNEAEPGSTMRVVTGLVLLVYAASLAITGGGTIRWDLAGVPLLTLAAAGVVATAAVGALPLVGRRIDPELIRRD